MHGSGGKNTVFRPSCLLKISRMAQHFPALFLSEATHIPRISALPYLSRTGLDRAGTEAMGEGSS
jgi:hypothetical protein